jgi:hypothetical protein
MKKPFCRHFMMALFYMAMFGAILAFFVIFVRRAREDARCAHCENSLKQIQLGLQSFHDTNGGLPPACLGDENGKPAHSWRALLMPLLGHYHWREAYKIKEPWDGPTNGQMQFWQFSEFRCPSADVDNGSRMTIDYVAVVGPDTMWPGRERIKLPEKADGNRDAILIIEMPDSDYRCLEPRNPTVDEFLAKIKSPTGKGIRCIHPKGLAYVTVGGAVRWLPPDTDPETIRQLFKRDPNCTIVPAEEKIEIVENWEKATESK